jgi:hypothetical protein
MLFRFYLIIIICLSGLPLLGKVQPLSHEEIVGFRAAQSAAIEGEKLTCGTTYDAVAILSLANKWKDPLARPDTNPEYTPEFLSRLVQGVCLGYGFKSGVQSSLKPSATDRVIFQTSLENAGAQLLVTSDLPTGAAVWSDTGESHNAHAVQMAEWLKVGRAGGDLDMEYPAAAGTLVVLPDASWGVMHENAVRPDDLVIHDWRGFGVKRLTNVPIRQGFYDNEFFQVTNCHPYNPTDVLKGAAKTMEQPIVIEYDYDAYKEDVPESIKKIAEGCATRLYLNVQDNTWNGNQILLRPHAMRWMFPSDNNNYGAVRAYGVDDAGQEIVNETSSVYPHSTRDLLQRTFIQASPPNVMVLKNVDPKKEMAFYSVVVYGRKAAITRHIFLTPEQREQLQLVFVPDAKAYKADEFQEFLKPGWRDFLFRMGIPPSLE